MKRKLTPYLLALALLCCAAVQPAFAYFTAHVEADGALPIALEAKTEIRDDYRDYTKTVSIQNTEGGLVWIRACVYVGATYADKLTVTHGEDWDEVTIDGDTWYVYGQPVAAGDSTGNLVIDISGIPAEDLDLSEKDFNVAVVYESCPVFYGEDGEALDPNWDVPLDTGSDAPAGGN